MSKSDVQQLEQPLMMLEKELEDVVQKLEKMGNSVQRAGKRTASFTKGLRKSAFSSVLGFAARTVGKTARNVGTAAAVNSITRSFEYGFDGGGSVTQGIMSAAASTPILGALFQDYAQPRKNATQRATAVLSRIARAGGTITDEMANDMLLKFIPEEVAARKAHKTVQRATHRPEVLEALKGALDEDSASGWATEIGLAIATAVGEFLRELSP